VAQIILADKQRSGRKGGKNGQMEGYDGPPIDTGSWGDLPKTCAYIEAHDDRNKGKTAGFKKAVIDYLTRSAKWPKGCYKGSAPGAENVYMTPEQVIELAQEMGMTAEEAGGEWERVEAAAGIGPQVETAATDSPGSTDDPGPNPGKSTISSSPGRTAGSTPASGSRKGASGGSTRSTGAGTGSPATKSARGKRATGSPSPKKGRR
jgi:hypothetical protein